MNVITFGLQAKPGRAARGGRETARVFANDHAVADPDCLIIEPYLHRFRLGSIVAKQLDALRGRL